MEDYDKAQDKTGVAIYYAMLSHGVSTEWSETQWRYFEQHNKFDRLDTKYEPRNSGAEEAGRGLPYPRAATLGGCTAHHAMIKISAHDSDRDSIAKLTCTAHGAPGKCGISSSGWESELLRLGRLHDWQDVESAHDRKTEPGPQWL